MALLPDERAGKICTVSAGSARFEANLYAPPGESVPAPILPDPGSGVLYHALDSEGHGAEHRLSLEVRATRADDLAGAVEALLRALSAHAALAGIVLETRAVRLRDPFVPDALLLGRLARDLRGPLDTGISFGPSWTLAPEAAVCVGASGRARELERLLRDHPAWQPVPF